MATGDNEETIVARPARCSVFEDACLLLWQAPWLKNLAVR